MSCFLFCFCNAPLPVLVREQVPGFLYSALYDGNYKSCNEDRTSQNIALSGHYSAAITKQKLL